MDNVAERPVLHGRARTRPVATNADPNLALYFNDLARRPLMTEAQARDAAQRIAAAEIDYWVVLLSHEAAAKLFLPDIQRLAAPVFTGNGLELPIQFAALLRLVQTKNPKKWRELSYQLGSAVRLQDGDRYWMVHARQIAQAMYDPDQRDDLPELNWPAAAQKAAVRRSHAAYLARIAQAFHTQQRAKQVFAAANLRLVISVARTFRNSTMSFADMVQEGNLGLIKAVERFDHTLGYRFSTYGSWWIRHAISRALSDTSRLVRIPVHMLENSNKVARATQAYLARQGREPTIDELQRETGLTMEQLNRILAIHRERPASLDRYVGAEDGATFIELLHDNTPSPDERLAASRQHDRIRNLLSTLTPIEQCIIRWRFGLDDEDELTLKEIGDKYNLSRERIRQLQEQALGKIRVQMAENNPAIKGKMKRGGRLTQPRNGRGARF